MTCMTYSRLVTRFNLNLLRRLPQGDSGAKIIKTLKILVFIALFGLISYRLHQLGFLRIIASLPVNPPYYVLFVVMYAATPVSEILIYRNLWRRRASALAPAMIKKRVLNEGVFGYSGEAYLALWARQNLALSDKRIFSTIKDNNLVSGFVSTSVTLCLALSIPVFLRGSPAFDIKEVDQTIIVTLMISMVTILFLILMRRRLLSLTGAPLLFLALVHSTRMIFVSCLQIALWLVVLPDVPISNWITIYTAYLLATRIPFLPSYDLILLGVGLSLAGTLAAPDDVVGGLFLAGAALSLILNITLATATSVTFRGLTAFKFGGKNCLAAQLANLRLSSLMRCVCDAPRSSASKRCELPRTRFRL